MSIIPVHRNIFSLFTRNLEASASYFLENIEDMFPEYYYASDLCCRLRCQANLEGVTRIKNPKILISSYFSSSHKMFSSVAQNVDTFDSFFCLYSDFVCFYAMSFLFAINV